MPSVYFDEMVNGADLKHILEDPALKGRPCPAMKDEAEDRGDGQLWREEDFDDDDDEPQLTEEQKRDIENRRKRLLGEYH